MGADVAPTMPPMTPPPIPAAPGSVPQDEYFCHGHSRSPTELKATAAPRAPRLLASRTKGPGVTRPPGEGRVWEEKPTGALGAGFQGLVDGGRSLFGLCPGETGAGLWSGDLGKAAGQRGLELGREDHARGREEGRGLAVHLSQIRTELGCRLPQAHTGRRQSWLCPIGQLRKDPTHLLGAEASGRRSLEPPGQPPGPPGEQAWVTVLPPQPPSRPRSGPLRAGAFPEPQPSRCRRNQLRWGLLKSRLPSSRKGDFGQSHEGRYHLQTKAGGLEQTFPLYPLKGINPAHGWTVGFQTPEPLCKRRSSPVVRTKPGRASEDGVWDFGTGGDLEAAPSGPATPVLQDR
ncbi:uncharacterized protein LOC107180508 [Panthera tigris]|uniref:uncharacterized protein LOC107180508 n=1 Tax=Panthera tigris TaxID=9694 RepID=UPI001C6F6D75|nr:uncharacterized protein LOC107180508 [Panthera tigris]